MSDDEIASVLKAYGGKSDPNDTPEDLSSPTSLDDSGALFPPSPPPVVRREHPLRVLSRAVRELREVIGRLEDENARLREERQPQPQPKLKSKAETEPIALPREQRGDHVGV